MSLRIHGVEYNSTVEDLVAATGYHPDHVRRLARTKKIPHIKRGRAYFFNLEAAMRVIVKSEEPVTNGNDTAEDLLNGI